MIRIASVLLLATAAFAQDASYGETYRLKVDVDGTPRKVGFFVPKNIGKRDMRPLVVALPDGANARGKAFRETGQFEQMAYEHRFAIVSVDITSSSMEGWHPNDAVAMERDTEAILSAVKAAKEKAKELGFSIDPTATAIRGHSGACFAALHVGVRNPDVFWVIALNGVPKWYPEFLKMDSKPDPQQWIHVYSGASDNGRVKRETKTTVEKLKEAGYPQITVETIKGMKHEPKPEIFVQWYAISLKRTAKGRKEAGKIAGEAEKLKTDLEKGKGGVIRKIAKLAEKEKKAGFGTAAQELLAGLEKEAAAAFAKAEDEAANHNVIEAAAALRDIEKKYAGLAIAKQAKSMRSKIQKSDEFKAAEMLAKGREMIEKGQRDKGVDVLVKLTEKFPETVAAERAKNLIER